MLNKIKGSALLSALFIVTLVAIAVTAISQRIQQDIYRRSLSLNADKLYLASDFVSFWAMHELVNEKNSFNAIDDKTKILDLSKRYEKIYPGLVIRGSIYDLQAKFNLNNLTDKKYFPLFLSILKKINLTRTESNALILALYNWLIPYQPSESINASLNFYLKQNPPYWPAKQLMQSFSEFRLVKGVEPETYNLLSTLTTALPEPTSININTVSKDLLMALTRNQHEDTIDRLIAERAENGPTDRKKLSRTLKKLNIKEDEIALSSNYFLVIAEVDGENLNFRRFTLMKRSQDKFGKFKVTILATTINSIL